VVEEQVEHHGDNRAALMPDSKILCNTRGSHHRPRRCTGSLIPVIATMPTSWANALIGKPRPGSTTATR